MDTEFRDETISAALDGERVDTVALRDALATDDGRRTLAAFVLLRAASAGDEIAPREDYEAPSSVLARHGRARWAAPARLALAASIVLTALVASFLLGTTLRTPSTALTLVAPPHVASAAAPEPIIFTTPAFDGPGGCRATPAPTLRRAWDQPPTPTRVLRFVPGVDWTSAAE